MKKFLFALALVSVPHVVNAQTFIKFCGSGYACPVDRNYTATDTVGFETWNNLRTNFTRLNTMFFSGTGSPEGVVTASVGALYRQTDSSVSGSVSGVGGNSPIWTKASGSGNTGWVQISFSQWFYTYTGSGLTNKTGTQSSLQVTPTGGSYNGIDIGFLATLTQSGAQNFTATDSYAFFSQAFASTSGTVTSLNAGWFNNIRNGGNITTQRGVYVQGNSISSGASTNSFGVHIAAPSIGSGGSMTIHRGLYIDPAVASGTISFNRAIGIGNQVTASTANSLAYEQDLPNSGYIRIWARGKQEQSISDSNSLTVTANDFLANQMTYNYTGGAPSTIIYGRLDNVTLNPSADLNQNVNGGEFDTTYQGTHATNAYLNALQGNAVWTSTGNNTAGLAGTQGNALVTPASGTVTVGDTEPIYASLTLNSHATVTTNETIYVDRAYGVSGSVGTIGKDYGVWLEDRRGFQTDGGTISTEQHLIHANISGATGKYFVDADGQTVSTSLQLDRNGVTKPTCGSAHRGKFWYTAGGAGVKDNVEVCAKDAADAYAWRTIY